MMKLKKVIASTLIVASVLALNPIGVSAEWRKDNTGWWYAEGSSWAKGWKHIDNKWYYFYSDGYMAHNRYTSNGYLASEGNLDTSSEGLSVNYPSNWIKSTMENGNTVYILDNKATYVSEVDANLQGKFNIDAVIKGVKSKFGISQVDTSQQTINGRTVDVLDYKFIENETKIEVQIHQVTFYNNNHVYGFTIGAIGDISSKNMDSFNDMLKTVTFAN